MSGVLFEDIFEVGKLNPDGKKFDRGKSNLCGAIHRREFEPNSVRVGVLATNKACDVTLLVDGSGVSRKRYHRGVC